VDLAGPHPFLSPVIGWHLFDALSAAEPPTDVHEPGSQALRRRSRRSLPLHLVQFEFVEQSGLLGLAHASEALLKTLRAKSLVREDADRLVPFSGAFASFWNGERRRTQPLTLARALPPGAN